MTAEIEVDLEINIDEVDNKLYRIIKQFEPFGPKNRTPTFVSINIRDCGWGKKVGEDKSHLRLVINNSKNRITCIGFGMGQHFEKITDNKTFNICYYIDQNTWKDKTSLQLRLKGIKSV